MAPGSDKSPPHAHLTQWDINLQIFFQRTQKELHLLEHPFRGYRMCRHTQARSDTFATLPVAL